MHAEDARIKRMTGRTETNVTAPKSPKPENNGAGKREKIQKPSRGGRSYVKKGIPVGGAREKAGRIPKAEKVEFLGVSATIEQHLIEDVEVIEINVQTGERKATKKPTVRAILDMLRHEALKNKSVSAAKEYMDRTLGRAKQKIDMTNDIVPEEEQRLPSRAEKAAAKAYLANLEDED